MWRRYPRLLARPEAQLAFEQLKKRLAEEGLFDAARKKAIPMLPQRIAVVTSPSGAAIRDILHVLGRRYDGLSVQIYAVRVQGPTAAREIATALGHLSRWGMHDVVLICRGGGSLEDLWPFNEEVVARAVAWCSIPTISGVGHETDFTICDLVADPGSGTPDRVGEPVLAPNYRYRTHDRRLDDSGKVGLDHEPSFRQRLDVGVIPDIVRRERRPLVFQASGQPTAHAGVV